MKILFLTRWYPPYGGIFVERHAQAVALNHELTVLAVLPGESSSGTNPVIDHPAVHREYTVIRYFYRPSLCRITCVAGLVNLLRFFSRSVAGYRYLAKQGISFDLVHVHILTRAAVLAYFLNLVKGTPYIITEHWTRYIPENHGFTGIIRKTFTRMILRRAAAATTVSSFLRSAMHDCGLDHKKFLIIPNVVDTGLFTIPGNDGNRNLKRIIHVSNFHERAKNIFGILRVISILRKQRQDFEVLFVGGKEPFLENAKKYASGLGLESPVVVFGEGVSQQVLVEEDPTLAFFTERLIEQGHKQLADRGRPRPGFMAEGDEGSRFERATDLPRRLGNFQTRFQDRQPLFKVGMLGHETPPICVLA